ncbi:MAG: UDP-glucose 4-epimerase GalE [Proteobacteria bacterium]|nr:UDP-glucose 4-epimerase GalE [Pseudomonadota bacterium]
MELLVTGGAGYIGSICVEQLLHQGHQVVVIDNLQEGHKEAIMPQAVFYEGDYGDRNLLRTIFISHRIEVVFHFAGETTIEFSMSNPTLYFHNNLVKGITLLDVMLECGCKDIIFSSTAATFGEPVYVPIDEMHPQRPINAYGESKLMFEKVLEWYHRAYGLRFNIFRYFNAAGASERLGEDHVHESHLIPLVLKAALRERAENKKNSTKKDVTITLNQSFSKMLSVFGNNYETKDGTCIRDYIHVIDLAQAHILAIENLEKRPNAKYNLGNGQGFSVLEVIETAKRITDIDIPYQFADRRPGDPAILIASSEKIKKELGWEPKYPDLETIIKTAWEWHCKHPQGYILWVM